MVSAILDVSRSIGGFLTGDSTRQANSDTAGQTFQPYADRYTQCEAYYDNAMYQFAAAVGQASAANKARSGLYRNIRPIRNPMRRAVDWYPGKLYPGAMTPDGLALPDGTPSCLPFDTDTDEALRLAVTQAFEWGNFGKERMVFGRALPMLGDQFGEITVDYARNKVYPTLTHPKFVIDAEWNGSGDLIMYRLKIPMYDEAGRKSYFWGKKVDQETVTTYYNDQPHGYDGQPATIPNPWGFVPASMCQFRNVGGQHGSPLSDGVREKIDELNNILAPIHDFIGKFVNQGVVISANGGRKAFEQANLGQTPIGATADLTNPQATKQMLNYLFAPDNATFHKLIENLGLGEADSHVMRQIQEVESDLPEATIDDRISQMGTPPSGKALSQMFGAPQTRATEAQANSDDFWITLAQMAVSIGGHQATSGAWGNRGGLTEAQQRFLPFSLDSYDRGDLNMTWLPRPIFPESQEDRIQRVILLESIKTTTGRRLAGLDEDTATALESDLATAAQANTARLTAAFNSGANAG